MLAKYNLYVGNECTSSPTCIAYGDEATGIQDSTMVGITANYPERKGTMEFSLVDYWSSDFSTYPVYVYNSNSAIYVFLEKYKNTLHDIGVMTENVNLISFEELEKLGCSIENKSCTSSSYKWIYSTTYWSGSAASDGRIYNVSDNGLFDHYKNYVNYYYGVRPVIKISKSEF